jgi:hypothetical protein
VLSAVSGQGMPEAIFRLKEIIDEAKVDERPAGDVGTPAPWRP